MNLLLKGDFILVKEVILEKKIEGTDLNMKYDDNEHFMVAEIVDISEDLPLEFAKYYPVLQTESYASLRNLVSSRLKPGTKVILQRIAKVPYKDGLYFASFKDILAIVKEDTWEAEEPKFKQMNLFE